MRPSSSFLVAVLSGLVGASQPELTSYTNPVLPGWNSDPSCSFVPEWNNTFFCSVSTFLAFPGLPVYASRDLLNWRFASNAYNRPEQIPPLLVATATEQDGITAPTIRFHNGTLYIIVASVNWNDFRPEFLLFKTTDPYDDAAWTQPVVIPSGNLAIDPDIFWDDDGTVYVAAAGPGFLQLQSVDIETGNSSDPVPTWSGTGGDAAEGPRIIKKDDLYYMLIAEGGTEVDHAVTIARSKSVHGPWESYEGNPILTNRGTDEYFQTVGHADLFQDAGGNWWGSALSTRSGPDWRNYPMGREGVLFPAKWEKGEWPVLEPVRGHMSGPLPKEDKNVPATGPWIDSGDKIDFVPGSKLPLHFMHWRPPPDREGDYVVSPPCHPNTLALRSSQANLTAYTGYEPSEGQTFVARRQSHTYFEFSADVSVPRRAASKSETGITVFLTPRQHIDLSIIMLEEPDQGSVPHLQLRTEAWGLRNATIPEAVVTPLPDGWGKAAVRLRVEAKDDTSYVFSASLPSEPKEKVILGSVSPEIVSGGSGRWTGTLLGVYTTTNGGEEGFHSYVRRWRYTPIGQKIDNDDE